MGKPDLKIGNTFFLNTRGKLIKICHKLDTIKTASTNFKQ